MAGVFDKKITNTFREKLCNECIELLIHAYRLSLKENIYSVDWVEDSFTAHLHHFIENIQFEKKWIVNPQGTIYDKDIIEGKKSAKKALKPDLTFQKYVLGCQKPFEYIIEAKNLSEKSWVKSKGAKVDASKQINRYIDTGIDNFRSERYKPGCLAGYIVQGKVSNIIVKINDKLEKMNRNEERLTEKIIFDDFKESYISKHNNYSNKEIILKHIMLKF